MTSKEKVDALKKAKANGKTTFVMANYDGVINGCRREVGDVISCHNTWKLAEKSAGRSTLIRIYDIDETLWYWDV